MLDVNCKAHELDNLYVVDTSVFPSIGAVNPALTAMANSLRVGDHLLERLARRDARMPLPSGEQIEIAAGEQRAVVVEVGAGSARTRSAAATSSTATRADEMAAPGRGQVLIPWPNRIEDGSYEFDGRGTSSRSTSPRHATRSTGSSAGSPGRSREREADRVVMEHTLHPQPGYPFSLALSIEYALSDDGLRVRTTATNVGRDAVPVRRAARIRT